LGRPFPTLPPSHSIYRFTLRYYALLYFILLYFALF